jgi:hypothetical protein
VVEVVGRVNKVKSSQIKSHVLSILSDSINACYLLEDSLVVGERV